MDWQWWFFALGSIYFGLHIVDWILTQIHGILNAIHNILNGE